jgi:hypothetical protein
VIQSFIDAEFTPSGSQIIVSSFADYDSGLTALALGQKDMQLKCNLHEVQENLSGVNIESATPPEVKKILISSDERFALILAKSFHPRLRAFRLDLVSGECSELGPMESPPTEAVISSNGHFAFVAAENGSLKSYDMHTGETVGGVDAGWASGIVATDSNNWVGYAQGALFRAIPLDVPSAVDELRNAN